MNAHSRTSVRQFRAVQAANAAIRAAAAPKSRERGTSYAYHRLRLQNGARSRRSESLMDRLQAYLLRTGRSLLGGARH